MALTIRLSCPLSCEEGDGRAHRWISIPTHGNQWLLQEQIWTSSEPGIARESCKSENIWFCRGGASIPWHFPDGAGCYWGMRHSCREEDGCMNSGLKDLQVSIISRVSSLLCQQLEQGSFLSFCFKKGQLKKCSNKAEFLLLHVSFLYFLSRLQPVLSYILWHKTLASQLHLSLYSVWASKGKVAEGENGKLKRLICQCHSPSPFLQVMRGNLPPKTKTILKSSRIESPLPKK